MTKKTIYSLLIFSTIACQSTVFADKTQDFFNAVENNKLEKVKELAPEIKDINATNKDGITAVHLACLKGHLNIVKYLASNEKVNFDIKTKWGAQHIHFVAQGGTIEAFNYLIKEKKTDMHKKDRGNRSPLWFALWNKQYKIAKIILDKSANQNLNIPDKTLNATPLWLALCFKQFDIALTILKKSTNQNFNIPDKRHNMTPLSIALELKQYKIAKIILEKSTDQNLNIPNKKHNQTPLWIALFDKQYDIARTILEKSTNKNFNTPNNINNQTPLWLALSNKQFDIALTILEKSTNKNFNIPHKTYNITPLSIALGLQQFNIAKIILEKSTNQNFNIPSGVFNATSLWLALSHQQFDIALTILEKSTDKNFNIIHKKHKTTPLSFALYYQRYDIAKMIIQKSTNQNFNVPDKSGKTYLLLAYYHKNLDMINILIKNGAKIQHQDLVIKIRNKDINDRIINYLRIVKAFDDQDEKIDFIKNQIYSSKNSEDQNIIDLIKIAFARSTIEILENNKKSHKSTIFYKLLQASKTDEKIREAILDTFNLEEQQDFINKKLNQDNNYVELLQLCANKMNLLRAKNIQNKEKLKKLDRQNRLFNNNNFTNLIIKTK